MFFIDTFIYYIFIYCKELSERLLRLNVFFYRHHVCTHTHVYVRAQELEWWWSGEHYYFLNVPETLKFDEFSRISRDVNKVTLVGYT